MLKSATTVLPRYLADPAALRISTTRAVACRSGSCSRSRLFTNQAINSDFALDVDQDDLSGLASIRRAKPRKSNLGPLTVKSSDDWHAELERRVDALDAGVIARTADPQFSEYELLSIYEDLLAPPVQTDDPKPNHRLRSRIDADIAVVNLLMEALPDVVDEKAPRDGSLSATLRMLRKPTMSLVICATHETTSPSPVNEQHSPSSSSPSHQRALRRLEKLAKKFPPTTVGGVADGATALPIILATEAEWKSLIRVCLHANDTDAAERCLHTMKAFGMSLPDDMIDLVMGKYCAAGLSSKVDGIIRQVVIGAPTETQRHIHVKAHLNAIPPGVFPSKALSCLHEYEAASCPAPMAAYTHAITVLLHNTSVPSMARAHAWDLFAHMRYVAHPQPDVFLYAVMLRACGTLSNAEPERAMDLWTEMTIDRRMLPTAEAYNGVILACARSGRKHYVHEAFRLAREMLDGHRDSRGHPAFAPSLSTFCALLEGVKRVGDLAKARWILAEIVKSSATSQSAGVAATEEVMMHVFHTYASYKPPFQRSLVQREDDGASSEKKPDSNPPEPPEGGMSPATLRSLSHVPPQSHSEVIQEARMLFSRICDDSANGPNGVSREWPFSLVEQTPRLRNSYLSVYYAHARLAECRALFTSLFSDLDGCTPRTIVEALERCANTRHDEREDALVWAKELWAMWEAHGLKFGTGKTARLIERAWAAHIRVLALANDIQGATSLLESFVKQYPPVKVRKPSPKPVMRSMRTALVAPRPLVHLTTPVETPDDGVPPVLTFRDLEILHHRIVTDLDPKRRRKRLGFVKWVCMAYSGSLKMRRHRTLESKPQETEVD